MGVEQFDQLGEVGERAGQPVDFIDNDHVDPVSANVIKELLERRPFHRAARVAAVVVVGPDQLPAFMSLALDVGFRGLPLIVERVELLLEAMLSRDAGVDGAAQYRFASLRSHGEAACRLGRGAKAASPSLIGVEATSDEAASQSPDLRGTIPDRSDLAARKPKKRWPFQLVPVIALATCDRLPYVSPFQATPWSRIITRSILPFHSRASRAPAFSLVPPRVVAIRASKGCKSDDASLRPFGWRRTRSVSLSSPPSAVAWMR